MLLVAGHLARYIALIDNGMTVTWRYHEDEDDGYLKNEKAVATAGSPGKDRRQDM